MGNCMGNCLPTPRKLFTSDDKTDFVDLISNGSEGSHNRRCFSIPRFYKRKKQKISKAAVLDLDDDIFTSSKNTYSKLNKQPIATDMQNIPLQYLDARALLINTANSTPASSLDLEWEHETLPLEVMQEPSTSLWNMVPSQQNISQSTALDDNNTDWSRVPSADSLEWDSVRNSLQTTPLPDVDADTQALLSEIERLTEQALKETGQTLTS